MIKMFVHKDHHELESIINNWIKKYNISIIDIKYTTIILDGEIVHSILIIF